MKMIHTLFYPAKRLGINLYCKISCMSSSSAFLIPPITIYIIIGSPRPNYANYLAPKKWRTNWETVRFSPLIYITPLKRITKSLGWEKYGLLLPSYIRLGKQATLEKRYVIKQSGTLEALEIEALKSILRKIFLLWFYPYILLNGSISE